jgi:hypothetical protein
VAFLFFGLRREKFRVPMLFDRYVIVQELFLCRFQIVSISLLLVGQKCCHCSAVQNFPERSCGLQKPATAAVVKTQRIGVR